MTHALRATAKEPYGPALQAHYADPGYQADGQKRYPLDSAEHCRAAWSYINQGDNASRYTPQQLKRIKSRIMTAGKKYGVTFADQGRSGGDGVTYWRSYFEEDDHPRGSGAEGGQFVKKAASSAGTSASKAAKAAPKKAPARKPPPKKAPAKKPVPAKAAPAKAPAKKAPVSEKGLIFEKGLGVKSDKGDDRVRLIQKSLNRLGISTGDDELLVDGRFGPSTVAAVKRAQRRLGLEPDGRVSVELMRKLESMKELPPKRKAKNCTCRSGNCMGERCDAGALEYRDLGMCVRAFDFNFEDRSGGMSRDGGRTLEGYAAVFGKRARITDVNGEFEESIAAGAFTRSLRTRTPVLQFEHGRDPRVGAVPIGAIEDLREDTKGLFVRATLFDNPVVEPVRQAIAGRAIRGMSFRFSVPKGGDKWERSFGGVDRREVRDADVFELGPVVHPAYDATTVDVRSMLAGLDATDMRALIRELDGYSDLAHDLQTITGSPVARSAGGGDFDAESQEWQASADIDHMQARDRALRLTGVLT